MTRQLQSQTMPSVQHTRLVFIQAGHPLEEQDGFVGTTGIETCQGLSKPGVSAVRPQATQDVENCIGTRYVALIGRQKSDLRQQLGVIGRKYDGCLTRNGCADLRRRPSILWAMHFVSCRIAFGDETQHALRSALQLEVVACLCLSQQTLQRTAGVISSPRTDVALGDALCGLERARK